MSKDELRYGSFRSPVEIHEDCSWLDQPTCRVKVEVIDLGIVHSLPFRFREQAWDKFLLEAPQLFICEPNIAVNQYPNTASTKKRLVLSDCLQQRRRPAPLPYTSRRLRDVLIDDIEPSILPVPLKPFLGGGLNRSLIKKRIELDGPAQILVFVPKAIRRRIAGADNRPMFHAIQLGMKPLKVTNLDLRLQEPLDFVRIASSTVEVAQYACHSFSLIEPEFARGAIAPERYREAC
jgi:hypothetical protein